MVEHGRHDAARTARRGGDDHASRGVLLGGRQRVGVDLGPRLERIVVALRLDPVGAGLAGDLQSSGQYAVVVQSALDRLAHDGPDPVEVVPYFGALAVVHVLPVGFAFVVAPLLDLRDGGQGVDAAGHFEPRGFVGQRAAADAVNLPRIDDLLSLQPFEQHAVGVEG